MCETNEFSPGRRAIQRRARRCALPHQVLKRMRQRMANGKSEGAQPEGVQKGLHLMSNALRAILQVPVVETHSRIDKDLFQSLAKAVSISREKNS